MLRRAKKLILAMLERLGYIVIKKGDAEAAAVAAKEAAIAREAAAARSVEIALRAQDEAETAARRATEEAKNTERRVINEAAAKRESEEASIRLQLEASPNDLDLLQRLHISLIKQEKSVPLELEDRVLTHRLERIHYKKGKLSRERTNEITLGDFERAGRRPGNLYLQITNECNLRCAMCAHKTATKDHSFMDDALFKRCLDQAAEHKIDNIVFAAAFGEALLHPKGMQYLRQSVERGFQVTIATNGNFLDEDQIKELASLRLDLIQYSFFGYDVPSYEKTYVGGKFEKAAENLRLLKAALLVSGTSTKLTVNGVNITNDPERTIKTREFLRTLGIQDSEMRLLAPCNFGGQISPGTKSQKINGKSFKPIDRLPLYICPLLLSTPGVMADGRMTACGCVDNNGSLSIGNIRTQSISEMRAGSRFQAMIDAFVKDDLSEFPLCAKCDIPYGNLHGEYNEPEA